MKIQIEYGETIIVAVVFHNKWSWYVTEKEYWFLDLTKLEKAFLIKGYGLPNLGDYSDRFDIGILDENSADKFLNEISEFKAFRYIKSSTITSAPASASAIIAVA